MALMVMKILILIFFFEIKGSKITRGHNYKLVKKAIMYGKTYQLSVYMYASSVNMFKNKLDKYLAGYT